MMPISSSILDKVGTTQNVKMTHSVIARAKPEAISEIASLALAMTTKLSFCNFYLSFYILIF